MMGTQHTSREEYEQGLLDELKEAFPAGSLDTVIEANVIRPSAGKNLLPSNIKFKAKGTPPDFFQKISDIIDDGYGLITFNVLGRLVFPEVDSYVQRAAAGPDEFSVSRLHRTLHINKTLLHLKNGASMYRTSFYDFPMSYSSIIAGYNQDSMFLYKSIGIAKEILSKYYVISGVQISETAERIKTERLMREKALMEQRKLAGAAHLQEQLRQAGYVLDRETGQYVLPESIAAKPTFRRPDQIRHLGE